jgi:hypothetical protein
MEIWKLLLVGKGSSLVTYVDVKRLVHMVLNAYYEFADLAATAEIG